MTNHASMAFSDRQQASIKHLLEAADRLFEWEFEHMDVLSTSQTIGFQWHTASGVSLVHGVLPALAMSGQSRSKAANDMVCCYSVSAGCQFSSKSGHIVNLKPNEFAVQQFSADCSWTINRPFRYTMLCIDKDVFEHHLPGYQVSSCARIQATHGLNEVLSNLLETAWSIARAGQFELTAPRLMRAMSELLSVSASVDYQSQQAKAPKCAENWRHQALQIITENYNAPCFGINDIARDLKISARYLQQIFSEEGTSISASIRECRLKEAAHLLLSECNQRGLITDIALRCGFGSSSRFSVEFKRRFGISPRQYRLYHHRKHMQ